MMYFTGTGSPTRYEIKDGVIWSTCCERGPSIIELKNNGEVMIGSEEEGLGLNSLEELDDVIRCLQECRKDVVRLSSDF